MRIFTIIGTLLLNSFMEHALFQRVSNEAFDYEEYFQEKDGTSQKNSKSPKNTPKLKTLKLSFWEYLASKFKKKSNLSLKSTIMLKSVKIMKKTLDVSLLINKLFDIEKLKLMFKNQEFEFLKNEKPKIVLDQERFNKLKFKTEIEKDFQKKFCIRKESKYLTHEQIFSAVQYRDAPMELCFHKFTVETNHEEKKNGDKNNQNLSIELAKNSGDIPR